MIYLYKKGVELFSFLAAPRSKDKDSARREFILNILLLSSLFLTFIAITTTIIGAIHTHSLYSTPKEIIIIFIIFLTAYIASRRGHARLGSFIMIFFYLFITSYSSYRWGASMPEGLLVYCLVIVMSGILISSFFAFVITGIIAVILLVLIYFQSSGTLVSPVGWMIDAPTIRDGIVFGVTLFVIALVAWLSNKEMEKALKRARASEAELRKQKDVLEIRVEQRTRELKQLQLEKIMQLYRFTEFGRLASGLFHDLVDPLNLVVLNLDELASQNKHVTSKELTNASELLARAVSGTKRMESFIKAARQQMQHQEELEDFSPEEEIEQTKLMLAYKAKEQQITITMDCPQELSLYGNPIKFRQVVSNLISNAIDSYDTVTDNRQREILVRLQKDKKTLRLTVQDNGSGIAEEYREKMFDPWFTMKETSKGTGLGLFIVKDIVEKDFHGKIAVSSKVNVGTTFTIDFLLAKA